jgi:hypothetical protein
MWQFIPGIFEKAPHGPFLHWAGSLGSKGRERESGWARDNSCHRSHCFAPKKPSTPYCNRPLVIQYYTSLGSHHTAGVAPNPITQRLARTIPTTLSLVRLFLLTSVAAAAGMLRWIAWTGQRRLRRRGCYCYRDQAEAGIQRRAMASDAPMSPELEQVDGEIQDIFRALQWVRSPTPHFYPFSRESVQWTAAGLPAALLEFLLVGSVCDEVSTPCDAAETGSRRSTR